VHDVDGDSVSRRLQEKSALMLRWSGPDHGLRISGNRRILETVTKKCGRHANSDSNTETCPYRMPKRI